MLQLNSNFNQLLLNFSCYHKRIIQQCFLGVANMNCWTVNYVSRRVCTLEVSSFNISSEDSHPGNHKPKLGYKRKCGSEEEAESVIEAAGEVECHKELPHPDNQTCEEDGLSRYTFRFLTYEPKQMYVFRVALIITGHYLKF